MFKLIDEALFFFSRFRKYKTVKILPFYKYDNSVAFRKYLKGDCRWNLLKLVNGKFADFYIIINYPKRRIGFSYYNPKRTIILQGEPKSTRLTWGKWGALAKNKFLSVFDIENNRFGWSWQISKEYNFLVAEPIEKTKVISTVLSNAYNLEGHRKRIDFLEFVDRRLDIDVYGRKNNYGKTTTKLFQFKNYKGCIVKKEEGLMPYKYVFVAENSQEQNYFSEKINDAILCECLCFYWGCPNLEQFIDTEAFIRLDLNSFEGSLKIINDAIECKEWEKRISSIRREKNKILNKLQIMPTIEKIIKATQK